MRKRDYLDDVQSWLIESNVNMMAVARGTGLGYQTIVNIKRGAANPTVSTLRAVDEFLWSENSRKTCHSCRWFIEEHDGFIGCEMAGGCGKEGDTACQMHSEGGDA